MKSSRVQPGKEPVQSNRHRGKKKSIFSSLFLFCAVLSKDLIKAGRRFMLKVWTKLLPMAPIIVLGVMAMICGLYQLISGKESLGMRGLRKRYNYSKKKARFIQVTGWFDLGVAFFCIVLFPTLYLFAPFTEMIVIVIFLLGILGVINHCILQFFTDNLETKHKRR